MTWARRNRPILFFIFLNMSILAGWRFFFRENTWVAGLGITILQTLALIFNFYYLYQASKKEVTRFKYFWRLLSVGTLIYLSGNITWLFPQIMSGQPVNSAIEFTLWLIAYVVYLAALIYRVWASDRASFKQYYHFNIAVFMVMLSSVIAYYLVDSAWDYTNNSIVMTLVTLAYPLINLSSFFMIAILYYLVQKNRENNKILFLIAGFSFTISADYVYTYLEMNGSYYPGSAPDYLWLFGLWLIGLSAYYVKKENEQQLFNISKPVKHADMMMPYIVTLILIGLVIDSYNWQLNALSLGALVIIVMIIGRQVYVLRQNDELIEEYSYLAHHDSLTGLKNRVSFKKELDAEMAVRKDNEIALLMIDLDRFKIVNDTLGHQVGDLLLKKIANRLLQIMEQGMQVFRLGGDEFAVIISRPKDDVCERIANKILLILQDPFSVDGHDITLTTSIGVSMYPENGKTYEELFRFADTAMYLAKDKGKNGFEFFNEQLNQIMSRRMTIENGLQNGLREGQFSLHYQPKVDLKTRQIIGMEALLRWNHPELGEISPVEFIPVAEETGHIIAIGEWVIREACRQNKRWQRKGLPFLPVAVNVSVKQFQNGKLLSYIKRVLHETGMESRYLELEVTESIMQDIHQSSPVLHDLREMKISISIDDFGTGYSSLHIIQKLPVDTIKLDKSFIAEMEEPSQLAFVKSLIALGESLDLAVVAEGVETESQVNKLLDSRCRIGQGYLFSRPVPVDAFEEMMKDTLINREIRKLGT
ncbi:EAL domain-containing protein [Alkalibacterium pelagium]|uniref:Diguanylate cyclase (GGDEF) domain-containing protein n=2 Tax=Alkalibacterium pelagium TaxID=426702 RepID=A0A1H7KH81_9LACT|nr:EAL domain-containing protein [Alkalibacterium pelagium]SEK85870.1 diguanylate cyclase (GGDEF) domain-containing protein [Alkalibacterium pelagium]